MNMADLIAQSVAYEEERKRNFANPPSDCKHELVYCKQGDDMHCHYCDKYMYNLSHVD